MVHKQRRRGFKLTEALFVVVIFVILIGLLIPAVQNTRNGHGTRNTCISQLKQLGVAAHNYHSANKRFPPGYDVASGYGCLVYLLPYMENDMVYREVKLGGATATAAVQTTIQTLICPSDPVSPGTAPTVGTVTVADSSIAPMVPTMSGVLNGKTNYTGVAGVAGSLQKPGIDGTARIDLYQFEGILTKKTADTLTAKLADIVDGTSNTLLFGEGLGGKLNPRDTMWSWAYVGSVNTWLGLTDAQLPDKAAPHPSAGDFNSPHAGIVNFCFADGSVKSLRIGKTATAPFGTAGEWYFLQQLAGMRDGTKIEEAKTLILD